MNDLTAKISAIPPKAWLLIASAVYLAHELGFHALVIDAALQGEPGSVGDIEWYGRLLAGLGAALLVVRFYRAADTKKVALAAVSVAIGMFLLQGWIIDGLVSRTSPEQRWAAQYVVLMQQGLRHGAISIDDVAPEVVGSTAQYSALIALGGPVLMQPEYVSRLRSDFDHVAEAVTRDDVAAWLVGEGYQQYQGAMATARGTYIEQLQSIRDQRERVNTLVNQHFGRITRQIGAIQACGNQFCRASAERTWEQMFKISGVPALPWQSFCTVGTRSVHAGGTWVAVDHHDCSGLTPARAAGIARAAYGLPDHDPSFQEFLALPEVRARALTWDGSDNQLKLPEIISPNWTMAEFSEAFSENVLARANTKMRARFDRPVVAYAPGGEAEEEGEMYMRAIYIPPVAIAFSLVFSVLNFGGLLLSLGLRPVLVAGLGAGTGVVAAVFAPPTPLLGGLGNALLALEPVIYAVGRALVPVTLGGLI